MLIEIHILQNHAPSNLNRDDSGSPKTATFGDVKRARISSQCIKRSVRRSELFGAKMGAHLATRTRRLPELIKARFAADAEVSQYAEIAAQRASGFGTSAGTENTKGKLETAQTILFTKADLDAVFDVLKTAALEAGSPEEFKEDKKAAKDKKYTAAQLQDKARQKGFRPLAVDVALFGRMVTSEAFRDVEASAQVAHAISTNKVTPQFDYFTAVDDLQSADVTIEGDAGADIIGDIEFNSACYYKYFSIHPDALVDNLVGAEFRREVSGEERDQQVELAALAVAEFVRAATRVTPTGKQNSFAAHQLPYAILVEVRPHALPVSYANAFVEPARGGNGKSLTRDSFDKLKSHVEALTRKFDLETQARFLLTEEDGDAFQMAGVTSSASLNALCDALQNEVLQLKSGASNG